MVRVAPAGTVPRLHGNVVTQAPAFETNESPAGVGSLTWSDGLSAVVHLAEPAGQLYVDEGNGWTKIADGGPASGGGLSEDPVRGVLVAPRGATVFEYDLQVGAWARVEDAARVDVDRLGPGRTTGVEIVTMVADHDRLLRCAPPLL